jgi:hypothetical protein
MPLYHFVVRTGDHTHDPDDVQLPDHYAAKALASRIVSELKDGGYCPGNATLVINDETGRTVHSIRF